MVSKTLGIQAIFEILALDYMYLQIGSIIARTRRKYGPYSLAYKI